MLGVELRQGRSNRFESPTCKLPRSRLPVERLFPQKPIPAIFPCLIPTR